MEMCLGRWGPSHVHPSRLSHTSSYIAEGPLLLPNQLGCVACEQREERKPMHKTAQQRRTVARAASNKITGGPVSGDIDDHGR